MNFSARLLRRPKQGESEDDMQDQGVADPLLGYAAVADGATDSAFQALWAELLVKAWVASPPFDWQQGAINEWLRERHAAWRARIDWDALPWHGYNKAQTVGGLATLLGVRWPAPATPEPSEPRLPEPLPLEDGDSLQLFSVGDCGVLVVGQEPALHRAWPHEECGAFGNTPALLSSLRPIAPELWEETVTVGRLPVAPGEALLLCTDAAFAWLLGLLAEERETIGPLARILAHAAAPFVDGDAPPDPASVTAADALLAAARAERRLRNDDFTILFLIPRA